MKNVRNIFSSILIGVFSGFSLVANCRPSAQNSIPENKSNPKWQLVWSDEFNYSGLPDSTKWSYDVGGQGWGNNEAQYYTKARLENSEVNDGFLNIRAIKEDYQNLKYTSARLVTKSKGDWLYGRFEIRAKLPDGRGMWPAIWMLPTDWKYGGWPKSGEIDIMENVGYDPYVIVASAHTSSYNHIQGTQKNNKITIDDCYTNFHVYTLEWEANEYRIYVDDKLYFTFKNERSGYETWPFDKQFHLLLNVAVGGNWGGQQGIDETIFPRTMVIDYVRVYKNNSSFKK